MMKPTHMNGLFYEYLTKTFERISSSIYHIELDDEKKNQSKYYLQNEIEVNFNLHGFSPVWICVVVAFEWGNDYMEKLKFNLFIFNQS